MKLIPDALRSFLGGVGQSEVKGFIDKSESSAMIDSLNSTLIPHSQVVTDEPDVGVMSRFSGIFVDPSHNDYKSNGEMLLLHAMNKEVKTKADLMQKLSVIREYDYIESTLRDLATEVLTKSYNESQGPFFVFRATEEEFVHLEEKVNEDLLELKLYESLNEVLEELLFTGQYIFRMDYNNNELDDNLDQSKVLPAYAKTSMVKVYDKEKGVLKDSKDFLVLNLFTSSKKLRVKTSSDSFYNLKLPRGIISESLIPKINNLKLLEALQPLIEMHAIDEKMYFYVRFPPGKDVTEAYGEARGYEKILKSMLSFDDAKSIDDVVDRVSKVKVIPLFGNQDEIRPQTISKVQRIELDQLKDLRDSISRAMKVNISGDNESNTEYQKLIKRIRTFIQKSVKEFLIGYIEKRHNVTLTSKDFTLLVPEVRGVDELESVDYISLAANSSNEVIGMITKMSEALTELSANPNIDSEFLREFFNEKLSPITNRDVFIDPNEKEEGE